MFLKAEIVKCNMVVEDYLLSVKAQGDTGLQSFLKNFAEKQYKGIATYLLQTNVCYFLIKNFWYNALFYFSGFKKNI